MKERGTFVVTLTSAGASVSMRLKGFTTKVYCDKQGAVRRAILYAGRYHFFIFISLLLFYHTIYQTISRHLRKLLSFLFFLCLFVFFFLVTRYFL